MQTESRDRDMVLVVDDNADELRLLLESLEQAGLTALAAKSGEDALSLLARVTPDLVVLDAVMAGLDGFETCQRIKAQPGFAHLPVIFLTGLKDTEHVLRGLSAGGVDYVSKPVIIEELVARIRIHMKNAKAAHGARVALDATGRHLLATDRAGRPLWCTPQAIALLSELPGSAQDLPEAFPEDLRAALAGRANAALLAPQGRRFSVAFLGEISRDEMLFSLAEGATGTPEERLTKAFALTERESEVLVWIARGKSNQDIAQILAISPRTVHKHLERIFPKLGVENRSAATSLALSTLQDN